VVVPVDHRYLGKPSGSRHIQSIQHILTLIILHSCTWTLLYSSSPSVFKEEEYIIIAMAKQTSQAGPRRRCNSVHLTQQTSHQTTLSSTSTSKLHHSHSSKQTHVNFHSLPKHIILLTFTILLTCITPTVSAKALYISEQMVETPKNLAPAVPEKPEDPRSALSRLALAGPILVDLSPPPRKDPNSNTWVLASLEEDLRRRKRQVGGDEQPSTSSRVSSTRASTTTRAAQVSTTVTGKTTPTSSATSAVAPEETGSTPLPKVFDSGFGGNLTNSCQTYMDNMLADKTFQSCLPISLLLAVSYTSTSSHAMSTNLIASVLERLLPDNEIGPPHHPSP
jgi:hypothetical protein